jgi:YHS domain-containing protein
LGTGTVVKGAAILYLIPVGALMSARGRLTPVITRIIKPALKAPEASMAIDPVCKMVVDPAEAPASFMYQDKNYYFCHRNCQESFMKDPESYL